MIMRSKTLIFSTAALLSVAGLANAQISADGIVNYADNDADGAEGVGVFNASIFDKLVVIVTGEHGFPNNTDGIFINGVTYDGVSMISAVTRDGLPEVNNASPDQLFNHMYYLDNPFGTTGTIAVNTSLSRLVVTAIGLNGTAEGIGATAISGISTNSVNLATTSANSYVIASNGLGGTGNNGNVDGLSTNPPQSLLSAVETNSNYAGHLIGGTTVTTPGTGSYSFTSGTDGSHVIAAEFLLGPPPPLLTLNVNTTNGVMTMLGDSVDPISINYYEITSSGNSLTTSGWNSFADQDLDGNGPANGSGNGWEEAGGSGSASLAEAYLLGNSEIAASSEVGLGKSYNTTTDARDLDFRFLTDRGKIYDGLIEYFSPVMGDANDDDLVNGTDLALLAANFGANSSMNWNTGDFNGDGTVNGTDLALLAGNFGFNGTIASEAPIGMSIEEAYAAIGVVPEPTSLALLSLGGLMLVRRRRSL